MFLIGPSFLDKHLVILQTLGHLYPIGLLLPRSCRKIQKRSSKVTFVAHEPVYQQIRPISELKFSEGPFL